MESRTMVRFAAVYPIHFSAQWTNVTGPTTKKSYWKRVKGEAFLPSCSGGGERVKLENENQGKLETCWVEMETRAEGGQAKSYPPGGE